MIVWVRLLVEAVRAKLSLGQAIFDFNFGMRRSEPVLVVLADGFFEFDLYGCKLIASVVALGYDDSDMVANEDPE